MIENKFKIFSRPDQCESDQEIINQIKNLSKRANLKEEGNNSEKRHTIDEKILCTLKEMGLFGITIPEQYGGSNGSMITYCAAIEELSRDIFAASNIIAVHAGLATFPILFWGSEYLKEKYLPDMATGKKVAAFGITEEAGSSIGETKTYAKSKEKNYIINGSKKFITNGPIADIIVTLTYDKDLGRKKGFTLLAIDKESKGFSVGTIEDKMSLNAAPVSELHFENVSVPKKNIIGEVGQGYKIVQETLEKGRGVLAAGVLGVCKSAFEIMIEYVSERKQFGNPLVMNTSIQEKIGRMKSLIQAMEASIYYNASIQNKVLEGDYRIELSGTQTKIFCTETAYDFFRIASELMGGSGFVNSTFSRLYREATVIPRIYEGPNSVCSLLIARDLMK